MTGGWRAEMLAYLDALEATNQRLRARVAELEDELRRLKVDPGPEAPGPVREDDTR